MPVLHKLADLIDSRVEELAKIASREMGKLIEQSRGEVKLCAQIARYYADNAKQFLAPVPYKTEFGDAWVEHHPIGVIMAVEPWNFPYYQLMRVLAPNPPQVTRCWRNMPASYRTAPRRLPIWCVKLARRTAHGPTCLFPPIRWRISSPTRACRARR